MVASKDAYPFELQAEEGTRNRKTAEGGGVRGAGARAPEEGDRHGEVT